jgi:uncharacterized protein
MKHLLIRMKNATVRVRLNGSQTAGQVWDALPIRSFTSLWGQEIFFQIPLKAEAEQGFSSTTVEIGDVAYWPQGQCLCVFFGPTPVSRPGEITAASEVTVVGKIEADWEHLKQVTPDEPVLVEEDK